MCPGAVGNSWVATGASKDVSSGRQGRVLPSGTAGWPAPRCVFMEEQGTKYFVYITGYQMRLEGTQTNPAWWGTQGGDGRWWVARAG